jgi:CysZ protein
MNTPKPRNNPVSGAGYLLRGLGMLTHPQLRRFVIVPLLVNVIVFSAIAWGGYELFSFLLDKYLPEDGWLSWLRWLIWPLLALTGVLITFYTFTTIANLIASPFNGLLAERVEILLTGKSPEAPGGGVIKDLLPAIFSELRKINYFIWRAIPLLILFVIPVVQIAAPFLWLLFSAWFLALEYADYPMGNSGLKFEEELTSLRKMRMNGLGFGGAATALMAVPILNFVVMPAAVIGATVMWVEQRDRL